MRQQDDKSYRSRSEMFEDIVMSLGGRMAEKIFLDDISTGASGDIQQATNTARNMVTVYGMSDRLGPISFDSSGHSIFIGRDFGQTKSYSEETAAIIDEEIKRIFDEAAAKCEEILRAHADVLTRRGRVPAPAREHGRRRLQLPRPQDLPLQEGRDPDPGDQAAEPPAEPSAEENRKTAE